MEAYKAAEAKTAGSGLKMDQIFSLLRYFRVLVRVACLEPNC